LEDSHNCVAGAVLVNGLGPFESEKVVVEGVNDCVTRFAFMDTVRREEREVELASKGKAINVITKTVVGEQGLVYCDQMVLGKEEP
jgi:hypothetical protein